MWEHVYTEGLSLQLQSLLLNQITPDAYGSWLVVLFDTLDRDCRTCKKPTFHFLRSFEGADKHNKTVDEADAIHQTYLNFLKRRPEDLNLILWFLLRPIALDPSTRTEATKNGEDLVLTQTRLNNILQSKLVATIDAFFFFWFRHRVLFFKIAYSRYNNPPWYMFVDQ